MPVGVPGIDHESERGLSFFDTKNMPTRSGTCSEGKATNSPDLSRRLTTVRYRRRLPRKPLQM